jgi:hypothetical protein
VLFRPNSLGSRSHGEEVAKYFDTSAFALNAIGQFGNIGRNTMIGPGQANMDAAVMKIFQITEMMRLQFRAEFFNAFNRVNFGLPGNIVSAGSFGRITSAGSPRVVQFGLKANW